MVERALGKRLCRRRAVLCENLLFQRAAVDADADRHMMHPAGIGNRLDAILVPNVAGVDADFVHARIHAGERHAVVKMNVRNERHGDARLLDGGKGLRRLHSGRSDAHDVAARVGKRAHLRSSRRDVKRVGIGHRLHGNRVLPADGHAADRNLPRGAADRIVFFQHQRPPPNSFAISLKVTSTISPSKSTMPTKCTAASYLAGTFFLKIIS